MSSADKRYDEMGKGEKEREALGYLGNVWRKIAEYYCEVEKDCRRLP